MGVGGASAHAVPNRKPMMKRTKIINALIIMVLRLIDPAPKFSGAEVRGRKMERQRMMREAMLNNSIIKAEER